MNKIKFLNKLENELDYSQLILINFNIYYNPLYIDYYVDYHCGRYGKCYKFIMSNLDILNIKHTPKKFLKIAKGLLKGM